MSKLIVLMFILISVCLTINAVYTFIQSFNLDELILKLTVANVVMLAPLTIKLFNIKFDLLKL